MGQNTRLQSSGSTPPAVYHWEGCSPNFVFACFFPCYPLCCWTRTLFPMENGFMIAPPQSQPGMQSTVMGQAVQLAQESGIAVGHPVAVQAQGNQPDASTEAV